MTSEAKGGAVPEATEGAVPLVIGGPTGVALPPAIGGPLGGEIGALGGRAPLIDDGSGGDSHRNWTVSFVDTSSEERVQRLGCIKLHQVSHWITIRDEDNDILAGRYLQDEETPKIGLTMEIDGFKLIVGDLHEAHQGDLHKSKVSFDLLSNSPRFGGRFWVLADQESDDEVEEINYEEFDSPTAVADAVRLEPGTIRQRVRAEARGPRKDMAAQGPP
ncbi:hypothetical protein ZWY2020_042185 [Hordeum vulgare]|nr:hypothetical protein ZWY2020_042185 [Hordeum vulgare]